MPVNSRMEKGPMATSDYNKGIINWKELISMISTGTYLKEIGVSLMLDSAE